MGNKNNKRTAQTKRKFQENRFTKSKVTSECSKTASEKKLSNVICRDEPKSIDNQSDETQNTYRELSDFSGFQRISDVSEFGKDTFFCSVCTYSCSFKPNMQKHIRIHTGHRPYICTMCQKEFNTKENLKVHFRIHTGEQPFQCVVCEKKFRTKQSMKKHLSVHTKV